MDGFSYYNIFDTKGMEYLVVIGFLILMIPMWYFMKERSFNSVKIREKLRALSLQNLNMPRGLFYSRNHAWLFMERDGMVKMGLDDLLLQITGAVKLHILKNDGEEVKKGDVLAELFQDGKRLRLLSPITGSIVSANQAVQKNPSMLNIDPYGKGWIFSISPDKWKEATAEMMYPGESTTWFSKELDRFKDYISKNVTRYIGDHEMAVLQDGGELSIHTLSMMPAECWEDFEKEFFQV